ncbi:serine/threonine-protein phosphatase 6 regulatory ankyrin repeat subunit C-like [Artemia franciscana]|uniref:serine/threonine-protein phosphatase 6 regulatory ankyrin repeat subunit C-like n=1 Tax=Artemia franciscana TaxID=6661 RepID=UPI0032DB6F9F
MILDKGARIHAVDKLGETPLHCAIKNSDKNVEMTKLMLKHGSNVKVRTNYGRSPLHLVASRRCPQTVDYLLMHGADVNVIEYNGASPLHLAASGGCSQTVDYVLKYGAHVDHVYTCTWHKGYTPLHCAA